MNTSLAPAASALATRLATLSSHAALPLAQNGRLAEFGELWHTFQHTGGLASGDQLAAWMRQGLPQPISQLARWIVARQIVSIEWQGRTLVPMFQFQTGLASLRPGMALLMMELVDVFDDWELALWFARSNSSLEGAAPAEVLATRLPEVWEAARTDRFIAAGC